MGNAQHGIFIAASDNSVYNIGGTGTFEGSVISGNAQNGIQIQNNTAAGNTIVNNFIGTNAGGDNPGNSLNGVQIGLSNSQTQKPYSNSIGEPVSDSGNTIAFNGGDGVNIVFGYANRIQRNSIYSNGGLGIDLETNGVTPNDLDDSDAGANNLQNFPVIVNASPAQLGGCRNFKINFELSDQRLVSDKSEYGGFDDSGQ